MAAVSLFWDTNMAAMTSRENTLYSSRHRNDKREGCVKAESDLITL